MSMTALAVILIFSPVQIHSWYDQSCCKDRDCHPVNCDTVHKTYDGGWNWEGIHFDRQKLRVSQDDGCHVCVIPDAGVLEGICIYLPWNS